MATKTGRRNGTKTQGYFYRSGRGWCASDKTPLVDTQGIKIRDRNASGKRLNEAYSLYLQRKQQEVTAAEKKDDLTVMEIGRAYLDHVEVQAGTPKCGQKEHPTYTIRADAIFDFCTGLPPRFRKSQANAGKDDREAKRIHNGYGKVKVGEITKHDIDVWLRQHKNWDGAKRTKIQSLLAMFNWAASRDLTTCNPIKGYPLPKPRSRVTYFTPEQEKGLYANSNPRFGEAIKVCIRTGARPEIEFASLTDKHVCETDHGQQWRFKLMSKTGSYTGKERVIYIADDIADLVRTKLASQGLGYVFRNTHDGRWTATAMKSAFDRARDKLERQGIVFDDDACFYSCRHTFAKRTLSGYWTGQKSNLEEIATLMGITIRVCWDHYSQFCETFTDPLWAAVNGKAANNGGH